MRVARLLIGATARGLLAPWPAVAEEPWPFSWPRAASPATRHCASRGRSPSTGVLGTIYEVFFVWEEAYERSGYARLPEFDRSAPGARAFRGVGFRNHPRGPRIGFWRWDLPGLRTAVHVDGTVNDDRDRDRGWTVEIAIPWTGLAQLARPDGRSLPPKEGDVWRVDFSRFNQSKEAPPARDPGGWAWSPHGVWDSHVPEVFPFITFSARSVRDTEATGPDRAVTGGTPWIDATL